MSGSVPTRWRKGEWLGGGTFGNVYLAFNSDSGFLCAMKEVLLVYGDPQSEESVKQLGQEILLLSKLRHQNIVQYIGTEMLDGRLCIYLEYASGGSVHKLLQAYGQFEEPVIRSYTRQILSGLAYLHNMNTVHRDIKGANILVDIHGNVKLADFGMAKHITAQSLALSPKGSPYWMAPEVIKRSNGYDLAVDIWSLGCTVLEMATAKPPWSEYEPIAAIFKIGGSEELPTIPDNLSLEGKDFVRLCLQRDPTKRPRARDLLRHPFVMNGSHDDKSDEYDVMTTATENMRNLEEENTKNSAEKDEVSINKALQAVIHKMGQFVIHKMGQFMFVQEEENTEDNAEKDEVSVNKALQAVIHKMGKFKKKDVSKYLRCYAEEMKENKVSERKMIKNFKCVVAFEIRARVKELEQERKSWEDFERSLRSEYHIYDSELFMQETRFLNMLFKQASF